MFGFRFSDSDYITIQCKVGIFPNTTSEVNCDFASFSSYGLYLRTNQLELCIYQKLYICSQCVSKSVKDEELKTQKLKPSLLLLRLGFMTTKTCIKWRTTVHKNHVHVNYLSCLFIASRFVPSTYTVTNYYSRRCISQFMENILVHGDLFLQLRYSQ